MKRWKPTKVNGHEDHLLDGHWTDLPSQQRSCAEIPLIWCLQGGPRDAGLPFFIASIRCFYHRLCVASPSDSAGPASPLPKAVRVIMNSEG